MGKHTVRKITGRRRKIGRRKTKLSYNDYAKRADYSDFKTEKMSYYAAATDVTGYYSGTGFYLL